MALLWFSAPGDLIINVYLLSGFVAMDSKFLYEFKVVVVVVVVVVIGVVVLAHLNLYVGICLYSLGTL